MFQHFVPHTARFRSIRAYRELLNLSLFMVQGFSSHAMSSPRKDFSRKLLAFYRERHAVPLRGYSLFPCRKTATITDDLLPRRANRVLSLVSFFLMCVETWILFIRHWSPSRLPREAHWTTDEIYRLILLIRCD